MGRLHLRFLGKSNYYLLRLLSKLKWIVKCNLKEFIELNIYRRISSAVLFCVLFSKIDSTKL